MVKDLDSIAKEEKWKKLELLRGLAIIIVFDYLRCFDGRSCDLTLLWRAGPHWADRLQEDRF